jgi:hypothetical protein
MNKKSIIEQIQAHGAVAAHATGRHVDIVNHVPVSVTMTTPIYMAKKSLRKGDKVAIIDMDENLAFICPVNGVETSSLSKIQTLSLGRAKKVKLE